MSVDQPLWTPTEAQRTTTQWAEFTRLLASDGLLPNPEVDSHALWRWSVTQPERFWAALWRFGGVIAEVRDDGAPYDDVLRGRERMAPPTREDGPTWFPGARLNFAENLLRRRDHGTALISWTEQGPGRRVSYAELANEVALCAAAMRAIGVVEGDRVAAWMPNVPETVVAMLAATSIGAVWSSCSPDFGAQGVLDRFGQIEPSLLILAEGYEYAGTYCDVLERAAQVVPQLPTVRQTWVVPVAGRTSSRTESAQEWTWWHDVMHAQRVIDASPELRFARLPFDHPLYILYSSGTTGLPKCIVHGAGGTLLQHLKEHMLHTDLRADDTIFYFTTCGWMMWNWLVSALAVGSTLVLYDGAPIPSADPAILWRMAEQERIAVFGTSARYLLALEKTGLRPRETFALDSLRAILSTGSPLAEPSYDFVYRDVAPAVQLASISGGTDIVSCFALGDPTSPVYRGALQMRGLGMAVDVWNDDGEPLRGEPGELVCTQPFPSMPVYFWNDPGHIKYSAAYFEHFPGVWRHGDWAELTSHDGLVIHGRSDATLNPGGVRIGTAEIYRQVETLPEVLESLVTEHAVAGGSGTTARIVLFVRLQPDATLDDALVRRIKSRIREHTSPHHVPQLIVAVPDIPRTRSGKISELAVRDVIHGRTVKNVEALANPEALAHFASLPALTG